MKSATIIEKLAEAQERLNSLKSELKRQRIRIEVLEELAKEEAEDESHPIQVTNGHKPAAVDLGTQLKLPPSKAIRVFLETRGASTRDEIISNLETKIESKSPNKAHILRTCLYQLVESGKVVQYEGDRYSLATN